MAANGDDEEYYGPKFDEFVTDQADSMDDVKKFVEAAELTVLKQKEKVSALSATGTEEEIKTAQPLKPTLSNDEKKEKRKEKNQKINERKQQKAMEKEEFKVDISGPKTMIHSSISYASSVGSGSPYLPPVSTSSSSLSSGSSKIETYVEIVKNWNGNGDQGKEVMLTESEMQELVQGLENILTKSKKNSKYHIGLSVGESKYKNHVCIKAIAGYVQEVSQATTHRPTYHFDVTNQFNIPSSLTDYELKK